MDSKYNHLEKEKQIYKYWEEIDAFSPEGVAKLRKKHGVTSTKDTYTVLLPPPNANGRIHVGHALMIAIEDVLIRRKRMQGFDTLWVPGTDHAGFETQIVYERHLESLGKSRFDFDRKTLYKKIFYFVEKNGSQIIEQVKALGPSLDWGRNTFMLDNKVINIVLSTFKKMYEDNLIYRDNYIVNYCTHHQTTLSDLELEYKDQKTPLYYIRYKLVDRKDSEPEFIVVATTRPEPIFIDTHLAINPKDKKNNWLKGRKVLNPLTGKEMTFVTDSFVDPEFGTGIVKLTPAHDKNDYKVALRYGLPIKPAFSTDGIILESGGELAGLTITQARKKAVGILQKKSLIEKIDDKYQNKVAVCYKCGTTIEPLVIPNWFVKVESIKKPALEVVKKGKVKIYPKWQQTKYFRWMQDMHDWPISRQIVWGIRIPAWYNIDKNPDLLVTFIKNGESITGTVGDLLKQHSFKDIESGLQSLIAPNSATFQVSKDKPGENFLQETDTFDTWFSSGQWPLTTLGFPNSKDFKKYYPTQVLETGWEILRFWVSRMIMFGIYNTGIPPFKDVYLHGLVRAEDGRKMSKSLGNVIDPLDSVKEYGADALRLGMIFGTANGKDFNYPEEKIVTMRNFSNKLWNMARFIQILSDSYTKEGGKIKNFADLTVLNDQDKLIFNDLKKTIKQVDHYLDVYKFAQAGDVIYHFLWNEVASVYIEQAKQREDKDIALAVLSYVFKNGLKLLHPFMPFVTEAVWQEIKTDGEPPLIIAPWPVS